MRNQAGFGSSKRHNACSGYCRSGNYVTSFAHNLYSINQVLKHKIDAAHNDPDRLVVWAIVAMLPAFVALLLFT